MSETAIDIFNMSEDEIQELLDANSGVDQGGVVRSYPSLKIEHVTIKGEPNPLRGHFTLRDKNELGEYVSVDIGTKVEGEILKRRYRLEYRTDEETYSSVEYDDPEEQIALFQRIGDKNKLVQKGTRDELRASFPYIDPKTGKTKSHLNVLSTLYILLNGKVVKYAMKFPGTIEFSNYSRNINPLGMVTEITPVEVLNGSVKYYSPTFTAVRKSDNFKLLLDIQAAIMEEISQKKSQFQSENLLTAGGK